MSSKRYHVFISYAVADIARVRPYVSLLKAAKLTVWWDQELREGAWASNIEKALDDAERVVVFISPKAGASGFVYAEAERARAAGKLVPVLLDRNIPFNLHGLTALLQRLDFSEITDPAQDARARSLCDLCSGGPADPSNLYAGKEDGDLSAWLQELLVSGDLPYAVALSVLEGLPHETVQAAADRLESLLRPEPSQSQTRSEWHSFSKTRKALMSACRAEIFEEIPEGLDTPVICARFADAAMAARILDEVWYEFDRLRPALTTWLQGLARSGSDAVRIGCAVSVGVLAQTRFQSVYDALIGRWIVADIAERSEDDGRSFIDDVAYRRVGDRALAIAALNPRVKNTVEAVLDSWSAPNASKDSIRVAIDLSCGFTGMRLPSAAMRSLRSLAKRKPHELFSGDVSLIDEASSAIRRLVALGGGSGDDALFDLPQFIEELEKWASAPASDDLPLLPDHLLLCALELVPVTTKKIGISLETLQSFPAWHAAIKAIDRFLSSTPLRRRAEDLLKRWTEAGGDGEASPAAVSFARGLWRVASSDRDRERLAFAVRRNITTNQLSADMDLIAKEAS